MMLFELIIFSTLLIAVSLTAGYFLGKQAHIEIQTPEKKQTIGELFQTEVQKHLQAPDHTEDMINHEGIGIVYRPSTEELAKMQESEQTKQAKQAIAETLAQTVPPEI